MRRQWAAYVAEERARAAATKAQWTRTRRTTPKLKGSLFTSAKRKAQALLGKACAEGDLGAVKRAVAAGGSSPLVSISALRSCAGAEGHASHEFSGLGHFRLFLPADGTAAAPGLY